MSDLTVPARNIPIPGSISDAAQMVLALPPQFRDGVSYPDLEDVEGWRAHVAERDELIGGLVLNQAAAVDATAEERDVDGVAVHVVTPAGAEDDVIVLDLHGGALIYMGGPACGAMAKLTAASTGFRTWSVDYRMPPDHPYPAGLDDTVSVYRTLVETHPAQQVAVVGGSSGGNLAAALILRVKEEGLPLPGALVLNTPEVDLTESGDTFHTNLGIDSMLASLMPINELYAGGRDLSEPLLSPLFGDLSGFPPTILTSGTRDLFLSNTVRMHRALRSAGVEAELHVLEAAPHGGFLGMAPEDAELMAEVRRFVRHHCLPSG